MTGREHVLAHCAMTFVSLGFSIWNVLAQSVTDGGADPLIFAFVREVGAAPLLLIASSAFVGLPRPRSRRDALNILLVGATGEAVGRGIGALELKSLLPLRRRTIWSPQCGTRV